MLGRFLSKTIRNVAARNFATSITVPLPGNDKYMLEDWPELPTTTEVTHSECKHMLREMQIMRRMETVCDNLYKNKEIRGFCHLYDGQEAVVMGMESALTYDDCVITAYRDHCNAYLRGIGVFEIFAEMLGKEGGSSKGKGGSMHYYNRQNNYYGGNGIVGAQIPVGAGLAFALKYQNKPNIAVAIYGDGAANQGQLYEASNIAKLWNLPCVFMCENNKYGMGTSIERASNEIRFHRRLGTVPGFDVDGLNVFAVREAYRYAKQHCPTKGPLTMNVHTYRYHGHSMSDPGITYRDREEVNYYRKELDCIDYLKRIMMENNIMSAAEIKEQEKEIRKFIDTEAKRAQGQPPVSMDYLLEDIYAPGEDWYIRGPLYEEGHFPEGKKY